MASAIIKTSDAWALQKFLQAHFITTRPAADTITALRVKSLKPKGVVMIDLVNFDNTTRHPEGVAVHAGFPNAGSEASGQALNLQQLLVPRPVSTFLFRVSGNEWVRYGIFDGDIAIIDRALTPGPRDLIVWWHAEHGDFALSRRQTMPARAASWGCVTSIIHQARRAV